jgi:ERF superfamily protein
MNRSETITKIAAALVKAQMEMGNAKKDATNPFFKKNYADLNSIREVSIPALNAHGISALQPTCVVDGKNYVETVLLHESGEFISSLTEIVVDKPNDAQRHGSGLSYARRYALQSIVNIGAEDDDANGAVGKAPVAPVKAATPVVKKTAKQQEELASALSGLDLLTTPQEVLDFGKIQPVYIVTDASFKDAANAKYKLLMATPATT